MKRYLVRIGAVLLALSWVMGSGPAHAQKFLVIGGGSSTGVYYQVALHVCKLVNKSLKSEGYTCIGRPALGSVFNVNAIRRGLLNFGVAQSDRNWQAYHGKADWDKKPYTGLRSVFSVHAETVMLVTRAGSSIKSVNDLRGKRVNIGNPGSGQRGNAMDILRIHKIDVKKDIRTEGLQQDQANRNLVDKKIDAFFYTVGNPWGGGLEISNSTPIRMIPLNSPGIQKLVSENPYYVMTVIPGGIYKGVNRDVPTYAVKATFVTDDKEPNDVVYNVVKAVFSRLGELQAAHGAFKTLKAEDMLKGLSAPLHPGALRYYKEKGWK